MKYWVASKNIIRTSGILTGCVGVLIYCYATTVSAGALEEGVWRGTYSNSQFRAKYIVTNASEGDDVKANIKMILPELEPRLDFTYELKDILISETGLSFTIAKKHETQKCTLEKTDTLGYLGTCQSDADKEGTKLIEISMTPPADTGESEATSVETENKQQE